MGSTDSYDPGNGPVLPDMPLSVSALAARLSDLLCQAHGLALPWIATADEANQLLALEFGPAEQTFRDLVAWAARFDGVMQSHSCGMFENPAMHAVVTFPFDGLTVTAFAFIPSNDQEGYSDDNRY